jgi:HK97 family phage prohead protease
MTHALTRAQVSTADQDDLPDEDFAYIESGGTKDASGKTVPRSLRHFPIMDAAHVRDALGRAPQSPFGDKAMPKILKAAKRFGIEAQDDSEPDADDKMRSRTPGPNDILRFDRVWDLEAIEIVRGGDGRTVEAYAAIWNTPAEVHDRYGHYMESIARGAFDKFINERGNRDLPVFYNHGMTVAGTPSDIYSVPIGRSLEVKAESRGLWTLSRYNDGPDADRVLEAIRNGAITAQSFRGRVFKSDPPGPIRRSRGELPHVTRTELGLSEYGPTPSAVYDDAKILALRSRELGIDLEQLLYDELLRRRTSTTPYAEPETLATSEEAGTDEPPAEALRSEITQSDIARKIEREKIRRRVREL